MKLKTLKDLWIGTEMGLVDVQTIKAEAIKRAKQCIRNINEKHYVVFNEGRLWEIMDFFNITEEDLLEEKRKEYFLDELNAEEKSK